MTFPTEAKAELEQDLTQDTSKNREEGFAEQDF